MSPWNRPRARREWLKYRSIRSAEDSASNGGFARVRGAFFRAPVPDHAARQNSASRYPRPFARDGAYRRAADKKLLFFFLCVRSDILRERRDPQARRARESRRE